MRRLSKPLRRLPPARRLIPRRPRGLRPPAGTRPATAPFPASSHSRKRLILGASLRSRRIDQPISPAARRNPVGERHGQAARGDVALPQKRRQQARIPARPSPRGLRWPGCRGGCRPGAAPLRPPANAIVGEPLLPPIVPGADQVLVGDVVGLELPAELRSTSAMHSGLAIGVKLEFEQSVMLEPFPAAAAGTDRDVGVAGPQVARARCWSSSAPPDRDAPSGTRRAATPARCWRRYGWS